VERHCRKADHLRYKGRKVSSFAVEAAVNAHPDRADPGVRAPPTRPPLATWDRDAGFSVER